MPRDFQIQGVTMVSVQGGAHLLLSGGVGGTLTELGLAKDTVKVHFYAHHERVQVDDYGSEVEADAYSQLVDAQIRMNLIHYDQDVLDTCLAESMGGIPGTPGTFAPAGTLLGGGRPIFASGNHYISLSLASASPPGDVQKIDRFPACRIIQPPLVFPLGAQASVVEVTWKAIPYNPAYTPSNQAGPGNWAEVSSSGLPLYTITGDLLPV